MRKTVRIAAAFALATSAVMTGCSEQLPTTPMDDLEASFFLHPPAPGFDALTRNVPLARDVAITRLVGAAGGRLDIDEAGISFVIPPNALSEETWITMTAIEGEAMAVEFAPHGLEFAVPSTLHFRARGTPAETEILQRPNGASLERFLGVYYRGDPLIGVEPLENISTYVLDGSIVFDIEHFSGYVCASG